MTKIISGTTPTITYKFSVVSVSDITSAILTIKERGENIIKKSLADAIEWGTLEQGVIERKKYTRPAPEPEDVVEE